MTDDERYRNEMQMEFNKAVQADLIEQRHQRRKFDNLLCLGVCYAAIIALVALWRTL